MAECWGFEHSVLIKGQKYFLNLVVAIQRFEPSIRNHMKQHFSLVFAE
jgi:hypothetical protein